MRMAVLILLEPDTGEIRKVAARFAPWRSKSFVNAFQKIRRVAVPSRDAVTNAATQQLLSLCVFALISVEHPERF